MSDENVLPLVPVHQKEVSIPNLVGDYINLDGTVWTVVHVDIDRGNYPRGCTPPRIVLTLG